MKHILTSEAHKVSGENGPSTEIDYHIQVQFSIKISVDV